MRRPPTPADSARDPLLRGVDPPPLPQALELSANEQHALSRHGRLLEPWAAEVVAQFADTSHHTAKAADFIARASADRLHQMLAAQQSHFLHLLKPTYTAHDRGRLRRAGRAHYIAEVNPLWVASTYELYAAVIESALQALSLSENERDGLRSAFRKRLRVDELWQLEGYRYAVMEQFKAAQAAARTDALTGLPNRVSVVEHIETACRSRPSGGGLLAVVMLDLDDFKEVNDRQGHAAGDDLLRQLAQRLRNLLHPAEFAARYAGDEFVILLDGLSSMAALYTRLDHLSCALAQPYRLADGQALYCGATLGATVYPNDTADAADLLRHADRALYVAKANKAMRRSRWAIYSDERDPRRRSQGLTRDLLRNLEVHYQPVIDVPRRAVVRLEALARLKQGAQLLLPGDFLPIFDADQRLLLFEAMLESTLGQLNLWDQSGQVFDLALNIEPYLPLQPGFFDLLSQALRRHDIEPRRLTLEILEDQHHVEEPALIAAFERLHTFGVRLAIDDMGASYSNLNRIRSLPVDVIKLDMQFAQSLRSGPDELPFVLSVMQLAHTLGLEFVVEGVEDAQSCAVLSNMGVQLMQGYGLCRPVPASALFASITACRSLLVQSRPPVSLLATYARQLALEGALLDLLALAPHLLNPAGLRDSRGCAQSLRAHPSLLALHNRQREVVAEALEASERSPAQLARWMREYKLLGAQLRRLMASQMKTDACPRPDASVHRDPEVPSPDSEWKSSDWPATVAGFD